MQIFKIKMNIEPLNISFCFYYLLIRAIECFFDTVFIHTESKQAFNVLQ